MDGLPSGVEREGAERELREMQGEARARAERPDEAATPLDAEPPSPTIAQRLRPAGMFLAGVATGVVSGSLGPPGAVAQAGINAKVEASGSSTDRFAFGLGQEVAGVFHIVHGIEMGIGSGGAEVITAGAATPLAVPAGLIGAMEVAGGVGLIAGGQHLAATGTVTAPAVDPTPSKTPSGIDDKHILDGDVKHVEGKCNRRRTWARCPLRCCSRRSSGGSPSCGPQAARVSWSMRERTNRGG